MCVSNADIMADRAHMVDEVSIVATNSFAAYTLRSTFGAPGERMAYGSNLARKWSDKS